MTPDAAIDAPKTPANLPPSTAGMTTKVVKGSLWTLAGQVAPLAVSLVTTPFTIRLLGAEGYGVLILVGLIPTYLGFADFGMSMASTKFGSEAYGEGDEEKEGRVVRTAALIALMSSVPVAALLIVFAGSVIGLFNVPPDYVAEATLALRLAAVTFVINILCGIFNTPQLARLRMDLNTLINAVPRILGLIATPIVIYLGYGILGAITVLLIASSANLFGHLAVSANALGQSLIARKEMVQMTPFLKFGGALVMANFAGIILANSEKLLLSSLNDVKSLAFYSVAFTLASMAVKFSGALTQSLIPAFSRLQGGENRKQFDLLLSRAVRLSFVMLLPILVALMIVARPFFSIWAGPEFGARSTEPFYILLVGTFFNILARFPYSILLASGRTDVLAKLYWYELIPFVIVVLILVSSFGVIGAAIAWTARVMVDSLLQFWLAKRYTTGRMEIQDLFKSPMILAYVILIVPSLVLILSSKSEYVLMAWTLIAIGLYIGIAWKASVKSDERAFILNAMLRRFHMICR